MTTTGLRHRLTRLFSGAAVRRAAAYGLAAIFALVCLWSLQSLTSPRIDRVTYRYDDRAPQTASLPFFVPSSGSTLTVDTQMVLSVLHPTLFRVKPDDCLEELTINGRKVDDAVAKFCDYGRGRHLDLGPYLRSGLNAVHAVIRDNGGKGGFDMEPARTDPLTAGIFFAILGIVAWYGMFLIRTFAKNRPSAPLWTIFLWGSLLRTLYVIATPYGVRGHDVDAHVDYVKYVAQHFWIPPASGGWEFHQPPLYYFLSGSWMAMMRFLGFADGAVLGQIQTGSLILSIATLGAGLWTGWILFGQKIPSPQWGEKAMVLYGSLLAVFPSLVFLSSRITNDALSTFFAFLVFALLLKLWSDRHMRDWYLIAVILALGMVTRISILVFVALAFTLFSLLRGISLKKKFLHGGTAVLILIVLAGWYPLKRLYFETDRQKTVTLGNHGMDNGLRVGNSRWNYLAFRPVQILRMPHNHPWKDEYRRQYFPEYFFKSAFFGEFSYPDAFEALKVLILVCGLLLIPFFLTGLGWSAWKEPYKTLPLWLGLFALLGAHAFYRFIAPYSSNQDFRFSVAVLVPAIAFAVTGVLKSPGSLRQAGIAAIAGLSGLCAAFLALLFFYPY